MTVIADSTAARSDRVFAQHQAAITLMQAALTQPAMKSYHWLDLACGRGQMIQALRDGLSEQSRAKLHYAGFDVQEEFARQTRQIADALSLASSEVKVGDLSDFDVILPLGRRYDFVSLTNTVHEVAPVALATLLVQCILRLSADGVLFLYDMERLKPPELGAVPWRVGEVRAIVFALLDALGAGAYRPEVGGWQHTSVLGWNVQIRRVHMGLDDNALAKAAPAAITATSAKVAELLKSKLDALGKVLENLTRYGSQTPEEEVSKVEALYEFWSLTRACRSAR